MGTTVAFGKLLGAIGDMKKTNKWGIILDFNGNVGTFMKYKASHVACGVDYTAMGGKAYDEQTMARKMIALRSGGIMAMDLDEFGNSDLIKPEMWLNPEWFQNIEDKEKFIHYDNIVKIGEKYPDITKDIIGENKVAYTHKHDPTYFCWIFKTKIGLTNKNFDPSKFTIIKV